MTNPRADPAPPAPTGGWLLRPGALVTRRDHQHLQVGLDPALVLPDTDANRRLLADLVAGRRLPDASRAGEAWRQLRAAGLVVAAEPLTRLLAVDDVDPYAVAAAYAQSEAQSGEARIAARARRGVAVEAPPGWADLASDLLRRSGVAVAGARQPRADVRLVVSVGPVDRTRLDDSMQHDQPHLVVATTERGVEVGPFVVPGWTACLRCVDAGRSEADPPWALIVDQVARRGPWRSDGVPAPVDPALTTAAVAWGVRDILSYLDDQTPSLWSTTVRWDAGAEPRWQRWPRHVGCGCAWLAVDRAEWAGAGGG